MISSILLIVFLSSVFVQTGLAIGPTKCKKNANLDTYLKEVRGLNSGSFWSDESIKTLPMHFISIQHSDAVETVSAEDAMQLGAGLNSVFRFAGIQFDFSYELLAQDRIPTTFTDRIPQYNGCKANQLGDGTCDCVRDQRTKKLTSGWCCSQDLWDGGDCWNATETAQYKSECSDGYASNGENGNGVCDWQCNNADNNWDGGDCCARPGQWCKWGFCCMDSRKSSSIQKKLTSSLVGYSDDDLAEWISKNIDYLDNLNAIKVFILPGTEGGGWGTLPYGYSSSTWTGHQMIRIHETGHNLGLDHVFIDKCNDMREFKSTWTGGDEIEDTAAVPSGSSTNLGPTRGCKLSESFPSSSFRQCNSDSQSPAQLFWRGDNAAALGNWMNYGFCRYSHGQFSAGQVAVMRCAVDELYKDIVLDESGLPDTTLVPTPTESAWISPARGSLWDAGGTLKLRFDTNSVFGTIELIRNKNRQSSVSVKIALVPLAAAAALRARNPTSYSVRQKSVESWMNPYIIFDGKLRGSSNRVATIPLTYSAGSDRVPYVTKGRYVLALQSDELDNSPADTLYFSPPFSVGYRTCQSTRSESRGVHGVCRPQAECQSRQDAVSSSGGCSGSWAAAGTSMVCCVVTGRNLQDELGDVFYDAHQDSVREQLPQFPVMGMTIDAADFKLDLTGSGFIGAPLKLAFDVSSLTPALTVNSETIFNLIFASDKYRAQGGGRVSISTSGNGLIEACKKWGIESECFGGQKGAAIPASELRVLELLPYGTSTFDSSSASTVDLLQRAKLEPGTAGSANRNALESPAGSITVTLPANLPERLYYVHMVAGVGIREDERFSAPLELNLAPCSKASGTCRTRASCSGFSADADACEGFGSDVVCCLGDPIAVLGNYRTDSVAGAAELAAANRHLIDVADGGETTDDSAPASSALVLLGVGAGLLAVCLGAVALVVALLKRGPSHGPGGRSSHRRSANNTSMRSRGRRSTRRSTGAVQVAQQQLQQPEPTTASRRSYGRISSTSKESLHQQPSFV